MPEQIYHSRRPRSPSQILHHKLWNRLASYTPDRMLIDHDPPHDVRSAVVAASFVEPCVACEQYDELAAAFERHALDLIEHSRSDPAFPHRWVNAEIHDAEDPCDRAR